MLQTSKLIKSTPIWLLNQSSLSIVTEELLNNFKQILSFKALLKDKGITIQLSIFQKSITLKLFLIIMAW